MKKYVIPQHLHKPLQILWFDTHEIYLMVGVYFLAMACGGFMWILMVEVPFLIIPWKRAANRGAMRHVLYTIGWHNFSGYPYFSAKSFRH